MDVLTAIKTRRSIAKVTQKPVPKELAEQIIAAGGHAPTHKRTDPWRFVVFEGYGRQQLQEAMFAGVAELNPTLSEDELSFKRDRMAGKASRAPLVIAVWCAAGRSKMNPPLIEDIAAVDACIQNMLLAAHSLGLGAIWRTGDVVHMPAVQALCTVAKDTFDGKKGDVIQGFVYIGYPDEEHTTPQRDIAPLTSKTQWITSASK